MKTYLIEIVLFIVIFFNAVDAKCQLDPVLCFVSKMSILRPQNRADNGHFAPSA